MFRGCLCICSFSTTNITAFFKLRNLAVKRTTFAWNLWSSCRWSLWKFITNSHQILIVFFFPLLLIFHEEMIATQEIDISTVQLGAHFFLADIKWLICGSQIYASHFIIFACRWAIVNPKVFCGFASNVMLLAFFILVIYAFIIAFYNKDIILFFFFTFFISICIIHLIIFFIRFITQVIRKLKAYMKRYSLKHCSLFMTIGLSIFRRIKIFVMMTLSVFFAFLFTVSCIMTIINIFFALTGLFLALKLQFEVLLF